MTKELEAALSFPIPMSYNQALAKYRATCEQLQAETDPAKAEALLVDLRLLRDHIMRMNDEIAAIPGI